VEAFLSFAEAEYDKSRDRRDALRSALGYCVRQKVALSALPQTEARLILLAASAGSSDVAIAKTVVVGASTVHRTTRRFVEEGLEVALSEWRRARSRDEQRIFLRREPLLLRSARPQKRTLARRCGNDGDRVDVGSRR